MCALRVEDWGLAVAKAQLGDVRGLYASEAGLGPASNTARKHACIQSITRTNTMSGTRSTYH